MITFMSCSISRIVSDRSLRIFRMNAVSAADSCGFMPAVGSSSSSSFGVGGERTRDLDAALVAVGQVDREVVEVARLQPDVGEHVGGRLADRHAPRAGPGRPADRADQARLHPRVLPDHDVLKRAHRAEQPDVLKRAGDRRRR